MKRTIIGLLSLSLLAACAQNSQCMGDGDDTYRKRDRDYNWYDGRNAWHGESKPTEGLYHNGAKDGQWTTAK